MKRAKMWSYFSMLVLFLGTVLQAQQPEAVPGLIRYSGVVKDSAGKPQAGITGITFALYNEEQGGAALWLETQNVQLDAIGHYSVRLGASTASGLPKELFASGEARWLGVQVSGQEEQPRVLLLSVPYALKAADAETLGGKPASAFLLAGSQSTTAASANSLGTGSSRRPKPITLALTPPRRPPLWT